MKRITFLILIIGLIFPLGRAFALTPNIISAKSNPGASVAILEGSINPNGVTTTAWFEYGTTETLNNFKETTHIYIGSSSFETPVKASLTELTPDTTYYFRLASDNGQSTAKGKTLSFKTMKDEYMTEDNKEEPKEREVVILDSGKEFEITTKQSDLNIGDEAQFLITFRNNTGRRFEDTKITVELPKGIEFKESNFGKEDNNTVTFDTDILIPEQLGSLTIKGTVTSDAEGKDLLVTTAVMSYSVSGSTKKEEKVDYVTNKIVEDNSLAAGAIHGNDNFLPNNLLDWLTLILVVSGLILVGKNLYRDIPPYKREDIKILD